MRGNLIFILGIVISLPSFSQKTYSFINGSVWDGKTFNKRDFWTMNATISFKKITKSDSTIDLSGKFIVPPFAEGHNHNLEGNYELEKRIANYMNNGVFYVKVLSAIKKRFNSNLTLLNKPSTPDVAYTFAPLTGPGGHPIRIREQAFDRGDYTGEFNSKSDLEGHGYFVVKDDEELKTKWKLLLADNPMFVKIMVLNSEEYEKRRDDPAFFGFKGINPSLIEKVVSMAKKSNLKVSAHIESAYDFRQAVKGGVNEIAHMPCLSKPCLLDEEDVKLAAKKGVLVTTTISLVGRLQGQSEKDSVLKYTARNLEMIKKHKVQLCIGSDSYYGNSIAEVISLQKLGVFTSAELLNMWFETAPLSIFPNRKIGKVLPGYETSFIVLNKNPIEDLEAVKSIHLMMKSGHILHKTVN